MKKQILLTTSLVALLLSPIAHSASISMNTRAIDQGVNNADFISSWGSQTSNITTTSVSEFSSFNSGKDSMSHLSVGFSTGIAADWGFQMGLDAHYGASVYLDGLEIGSRTDDLWWARSWSNSDVMTLLGNSLTVGAHTLDVYWAETCCNGDSAIRFNVAGAGWETLSVKNLNAAVAEPTTILLLVFGVGLLAYQNRKGNLYTA